MEKLAIGTKVTYTKEFMFGKTGTETAQIIMIHSHNFLLCNGDMIPKWEANRLTITK
jgi:hypothetical protein